MDNNETIITDAPKTVAKPTFKERSKKFVKSWGVPIALGATAAAAYIVGAAVGVAASSDRTTRGQLDINIRSLTEPDSPDSSDIEDAEIVTSDETTD